MRRLALSLALVLLAAGCTLPDPQPPASATPTTTPAPTPSPPAPYEPRFDGARAFEHVRAQVQDDAGKPLYRVPGTDGNRRVAEMIVGEMRALGFETSLHFFNATYGCVETPMHNVLAQRPGNSGKVVLLAAHYDTRPIADKDPDRSLREEPVLGANDGASGVAVLLELARVLPPTNDTVRFVFFDGEDGGGYKAPACKTDWILGSRAYAASLSEAEVASIRAMVLVDMVGDHDLKLPREGYSADDPRARGVQDQLYAIAAALGHPQFLDQAGASIIDDHVPFLERMVPAVDLIHTIPGDPRVFPAWHHTLADTLDAVSAESLDAVGETIEAWLAKGS